MLSEVVAGFTCVRFNRDHTSLMIGTDKVAKIFRLQDFKKIAEIEIKSPYIIEQLCGTEIIGVVGKSSPKRLELLRSNLPFKTLHFDACVLGVDTNRYVMVVGCADEAIVHDMLNYRPLHKIGWTLTNIRNLFVLSQGGGNASYLAYPCCEMVGDVKICEVSIKRKLTIRAHNSAVVSLAFHPSEQVLATASSKGTVIRLISIPSGTNLFEFRRGTQRTADIYSLSFSRDSNFLVSSGSTGTVHVFKYDLPWHKSENQSWAEYIGEAVKSSFNYFLAPSTELLINTRKTKGIGEAAGEVISSTNCFSKSLYEACTQVRSFLKIRLDGENIKNISIATRINDVMCVALYTEHGNLSIHNMDEDGKVVTTFSSIGQ